MGMDYEIQFVDHSPLLRNQSLKLISLTKSGKSNGMKVPGRANDHANVSCWIHLFQQMLDTLVLFSIS